MRIAYVTTKDPWDGLAWSGLDTHMLQALLSSGLEVDAIGNLNRNHPVAFIKGALYGRFFSKTYFVDHEPGVMKRSARQVATFLKSTTVAAVFSPRWGPVAYLKTDLPVAFWHDATIPALVELYPGYKTTCAESIRNGIEAERLALANCRLAIYSSEWAAQSAIAYYGVDPGKVKVIPFGANLDDSRTEDDFRTILHNKSWDVCRLLFVGKEWERKGGRTAVEVARRLNQVGIPTELHVVGCQPPGELPDFVKPHGFISKVSKESRQRLDELYSQAHFFILPTRADCTPVVFPEAGSFGLPVLTSCVGGIPTVIRQGENGFMFPLGEGPGGYCATIQRYWFARADYEQLARSSFREYAERLNWSIAGRQASELIQKYCQ